MRTQFLGISAALALMGCNKPEDRETADNADNAVEQNQGTAETTLNQIGADLHRAADRAEREAKIAAEKAKQAGQDAKEATSKSADKVERAAQAARAELKKDKE